MNDKVTEYRQADQPLPAHNVIWPLYGAGFENLGKDGAMLEVPLPQVGANQLLVRHDAVGICFSDIKIMKLGQEHPRIYRDMRTAPVVMGHEVSMTVVAVGENLRDKYRVGDRFIIQADVYVNGVGYAYGYEIDGGFSMYGLIDERILQGDEGNYLLAVQPDKGYAESALTEPWACVIAANRLTYRTALKPGGTTWIIGADPSDTRPYTISAGFDGVSHPATLLLSRVPAPFEAWLRERAAQLGIAVHEAPDLSAPPVEMIDDIVLLGADADALEASSRFLANGGVFAVVTDTAFSRPVQIDIGRVHYNNWVYVGGSSPDIARAYSDLPVRSELRKGGCAWFVGAAGPMGRMHVQRAIQMIDPPSEIVCTDVSQARLDDLYNSFAAEATERGISFVCTNPTTPEGKAIMQKYKVNGFDDIIVLAPVAALVSDCATYLAQDGVMNIFAGVARGVMATLDASDFALKRTRHIGQSGSTIEDLRVMLEQGEAGIISRNRSVAAVGSLDALPDGLRAVQDAVFPGKVVIFPHIRHLPLTPLADLKKVLPSVHARLKDGREWTVEAEEELLRVMLP
jgi:threonine dehydrogenase-like Zn-dependent dehydrogenase